MIARTLTLTRDITAAIIQSGFVAMLCAAIGA